MINKKAVILISIVFILLVGIGYGVIKYLESEETNEIEAQIIEGEYTPQEEITDNQLRQTIVNLYFLQDDELKKEGRLIDIKELYLDPYNELMNMLIDGPTNSQLDKLVPDDTKLIGTVLEENCLVIDMTSEILNYDKDSNQKELLIDSILSTMIQLIEVDSIRILVDR